jgi:hypothetical protein
VAALGPPPDDLTGFPQFSLIAARRLYRVFLRSHGAWWFSSDGSGRFDLSQPGGTCYLAEEPLGAFVEVFRDTAFVDERDVRARLLATVVLPDVDRPLADCTSRKARACGVTGAIHTTEDYVTTQQWARALHRAGYTGIRYFGGHDPALGVVSVAYFGGAGEQPHPVAVSELDPSLERAAYEQFGILVLPAPHGAG